MKEHGRPPPHSPAKRDRDQHYMPPGVSGSTLGAYVLPSQTAAALYIRGDACGRPGCSPNRPLCQRRLVSFWQKICLVRRTLGMPRPDLSWDNQCAVGGGNLAWLACRTTVPRTVLQTGHRLSQRAWRSVPPIPGECCPQPHATRAYLSPMRFCKPVCQSPSGRDHCLLHLYGPGGAYQQYSFTRAPDEPYLQPEPLSVPVPRTAVPQRRRGHWPQRSAPR